MNKLNKILTILIIPIGIIFLNGCVKEKFKSPAFICSGFSCSCKYYHQAAKKFTPDKEKWLCCSHSKQCNN